MEYRATEFGLRQGQVRRSSTSYRVDFSARPDQPVVAHGRLHVKRRLINQRNTNIEHQDCKCCLSLLGGQLTIEIVDVNLNAIVEVMEHALPRFGYLDPNLPTVFLAMIANRIPSLDQAFYETRSECRSDIEPCGDLLNPKRRPRASIDLDERLPSERVDLGRFRLLFDDAKNLPQHVSSFGNVTEIAMPVDALSGSLGASPATFQLRRTDDNIRIAHKLRHEAHRAMSTIDDPHPHYDRANWYTYTQRLKGFAKSGTTKMTVRCLASKGEELARPFDRCRTNSRFSSCSTREWCRRSFC